MASRTSQLIRAVEHSLDKNPEDWKIDGYEAVNAKAGVAVWYVNGWACAYLRIGDWQYPENNVSDWSVLFGWCTWRRRVVDRIRKIRKQRRAVDLTGPITKLMGAS